MSAQFKAALADLERIERHIRWAGAPVVSIRSALEAAQQEAERYTECKRLLLAAQRLFQDQAKELEAKEQESSTFESYGRAHETAGPSIFFSNGKWRGFITDELSSLCDGASYAEVHSKLATWCRAELAK